MPPSIPQRELMLGKVPNDVLKNIVFKLTGAQNPNVISGPAIGEDAAIIEYQGKFLVLKSDPITGAESNIGWLAVHVNANDIAVRGARPLYYLSVIILPQTFKDESLKRICKGVDSAAKELGVPVVGGHTEVTSAVSRPVVCGTMIGEVQKNKIILTSGAKIGDSIIVTKSAALEGTSIIASDRYDSLQGVLGKRLLRKAQQFWKQISVVKEAQATAETGCVNSMKDPTEGGLLQALNEIVEASHAGGYYVDENLIPIEKETLHICASLRVDPLRLISSGMLIVTAPKDKEEYVISKISEVGVRAVKIGTITARERIAKRRSCQTEFVEEFVTEQLWKALITKPEKPYQKKSALLRLIGEKTDEIKTGIDSLMHKPQEE